MLLKEFQALALDVRVLTDDGEEVDLSETTDYDRKIKNIIDEDSRERFEETLASQGYSELDDEGNPLEDSGLDDYSDEYSNDYDDDYVDDFDGDDF